MANGTVTITAKVDAAQAQRALELLEQDAKKLGVSYSGASSTTVGAANRAKRAIDLQTQATERAKQVAEEMGKSFGIGAAGGLTVFAAAAAGSVIALSKVKEGLAYSIQAASDYESSMKTLEIVTSRTGQSFADAKVLVDRYSDSISSPDAVAQAVRVFSTMNLSMDKQSELITGIRDGLIAMGMDVNEQLPLMALAIKRQESVLLDNMGVTRTIEMMYKEYAATIGTTVDQLTQQQKEQAVVNGVLQETATYTGVAAQSTDTYKGSVNSLNAANRQLATEVGKSINPTLTVMVNLLADGVHNIATFAGIWNTLAGINVNPYAWGTEPPKPSEYGLPTFPGVPGADQINAALGKGLPKITPPKTIPMIGAPGAIYAGTHNGGSTGGTHTGGSSGKSAAQIQADQEAQDRKQLAQRLQHDLFLVNKEGAEKQKAEAYLEHLDRLKQAHGDAKLEAQSRKLYYAEVGDIDKTERAKKAEEDKKSAEEAKKKAEDAAKDLRENTKDAVSQGLSMVASGDFSGLPKALGDKLQDAASGGIADALVKNKDVQKSLGSLGHALNGPVGIAAGFGALMVGAIVTATEKAKEEAEAFQDYMKNFDYQHDDQKTKVGDLLHEKENDTYLKELRDKRNTSVTWANYYNDPMHRDASMGKYYDGEVRKYNNEIGQVSDGYDKQIQKVINDVATSTDLSEDQVNAIRDQINASDALTEGQKKAFQEQLNLADTARKATEASAHVLQVANDLYQSKKTLKDMADNADVTLGNRASADLTAERARKDAIEKAMATVGGQGPMNTLLGMLGAGNLSGAQAAFGDTATQLDKILKAIETSRVGSSPDKPMYTVITNTQDFGFVPDQGYYRASGPRTRRDNSFRQRGI